MPAIIFDMDGVLVDSYRPHWRSWQATCATRSLPITEAAYAGLFGRSFRSFVEALCPRPLTEAEIQAWYDEKEELYRDIIERDFPAMDGATDLLGRLAAAGFALAIGSSGPRGNVDCLLRHLPGAAAFAATVSGDDCRHAKPDPEVFLLAARHLGVAPRDCAVIEDSLHGLEAARRAGMASIALTGTCTAEVLSPHADLVVTSLRDLTPPRITALIAGRKD